MQPMRLAQCSRPAQRLAPGSAAATVGGSARMRPRPSLRSFAAANSEPETDASAAASIPAASQAEAAAPAQPAAQEPPAAALPPPPPQQLLGASSSAAPAAAARRPPAARMSLQAFLEIDDGPPRVMSLLDPHMAPRPGAEDDRAAATGRADLPLLLYLPGIDGSGLAAARQFPSLLQRFDMRTLVTPPSVRRRGRPVAVRAAGAALRQCRPGDRAPTADPSPSSLPAHAPPATHAGPHAV